ncbi:MAG: carboxypeptidase regulatory-like domain-containing protein [Candidatus Acidiferrales bacterium]
MFGIFRRKTLILLIVLIALSTASFAQTDRATLEGTVTDPSGAAIRSAKIMVTNVDTGITQERNTNGNGYYRFPGLAIGEYTVIAANTGFKTKAIEDVTVQVGETRTLDVRLEIGSASEKVEVKAELTPEERSSAEASTVIRTDQILNLPNNGRDWASFTLLAPFAQDDGGGDQRTIRFAGRARDDNNFNFDGVDAGGIQEQAQKSQTRLQISQDAIAEYRVNSALYDAEYGTQAGGQVDVVTKSGTNVFHGTVFGYLRNSAFDARNFNDFDVNGNAAIPPFRMGQYGMTFGGPIVKEKAFFFLNYEGLRQLQSATTQTKVPSASIQQATLAASPQMCSILQAYPWRKSTGTIAGCAPRFVYPDAAFSPTDVATDQFTNASPSTVHEDTWLVRVDYKINEKTTLYGRAQRDISLVQAPNGVLDSVRTINHPANYFIALEHLFSPNLLNETKVFVNRAPFINPNASILPYSVSSNNWTGLNNNNADHEVGTTYGVIDNLTWTHGRSTFKAGLEIRRIRLNQGKTADNNLDFSDGAPIGDPSFVLAQVSTLTFDAPWCCHKFRRTFFMPYFQDEWKVRPNLTLNLGLRYEYYGVESEYDNRTTVFDLNQFHGVCEGSGTKNLPFTPAPINTPACPTNPSLYDPNYLNFDPRVSVAWAPEALHGKTVIRSGFGIYHGAAQNDDLNAGLESDTFRITYKPANPVPLQPEWQQEIPDLTNLPSNGTSPSQHPRALLRHNRRDLYVETWGLTVEHELPAHFLASAAYLGSHGVRLFARGAENLCNTPVSFDPSNLSGDCVRPLDVYYTYPNTDPSIPFNTVVKSPFGSVDLKYDGGASSYHGLLLTLQRQYSNGLSFQTRYTWSHSINDGAVGGGESNGAENVNCLRCEKGPSIFDIRHNFTANAVYELPFGAGKKYLSTSSLLGKMVGGWELSGIGIWHTGHPYTIKMNLHGSDTFLLPDGNDQTDQRPDLIPGVPLTVPGGGHNNVPIVNIAAFRAPPIDPVTGLFTHFGTAGNGIVRALNSWQADIALMKETKLTERFSMKFGVQFFNVFNHVQLGDPGTLSLDYSPAPGTSNLSDPGLFGVITSTGNFNNNNDNQASPNTGTGLPRQIQFMLRFEF